MLLNMNEMFLNNTFLNKAIELRYEENKIFNILNIMNEMKETNPHLTIEVFICILEKMLYPTIISTIRSKLLYRYSVELWNNYVFNRKNYNLLISYEGICF